MHVLESAAVGSSGARAEPVAAAAAAAPVGVKRPLALPAVDVKGSRRSLLVHHRLGFIHGGSSWPWPSLA